MKNLFFRLSLVGLVLVALVSCKKEKEMTTLNISISNGSYWAGEIDEVKAFLLSEPALELATSAFNSGNLEFRLPMDIESGYLYRMGDDIPAGVSISDFSAKAQTVGFVFYKNGKPVDYELTGLYDLGDITEDLVKIVTIQYATKPVDIVGLAHAQEGSMKQTATYDVHLKRGYNYSFIELTRISPNETGVKISTLPNKEITWKIYEKDTN